MSPPAPASAPARGPSCSPHTGGQGQAAGPGAGLGAWPSPGGRPAGGRGNRRLQLFPVFGSADAGSARAGFLHPLTRGVQVRHPGGHFLLMPVTSQPSDGKRGRLPRTPLGAAWGRVGGSRVPSPLPGSHPAPRGHCRGVEAVVALGTGCAYSCGELCGFSARGSHAGEVASGCPPGKLLGRGQAPQPRAAGWPGVTAGQCRGLPLPQRAPGQGRASAGLTSPDVPGAGCLRDLAGCCAGASAGASAGSTPGLLWHSGEMGHPAQLLSCPAWLAVAASILAAGRSSGCPESPSGDTSRSPGHPWPGRWVLGPQGDGAAVSLARPQLGGRLAAPAWCPAAGATGWGEPQDRGLPAPLPPPCARPPSSSRPHRAAAGSAHCWELLPGGVGSALAPAAGQRGTGHQ